MQIMFRSDRKFHQGKFFDDRVKQMVKIESKTVFFLTKRDSSEHLRETSVAVTPIGRIVN